MSASAVKLSYNGTEVTCRITFELPGITVFKISIPAKIQHDFVFLVKDYSWHSLSRTPIKGENVSLCFYWRGQHSIEEISRLTQIVLVDIHAD